MKKFFERALVFFLIQMLIFSVVPISGFAAGHTNTDFGLFYTVDNGTATITGHTDYLPSILNIPSEIDGYEVTAIGEAAFYDCFQLEELTIPDSVTTIQRKAFGRCSSLVYVHMSASVTSIGEGILEETTTYICSDTYDCYAMEYANTNDIDFVWCDLHEAKGYALNYAPYGSSVMVVGYIGSLPSELTFPSEFREYAVTCIADFSFGSCNDLIEVTIPKSVTEVNEAAFLGCNNLKK